MLVLTRKLMERVYIGDQICVTVVRLEGGQVRLGIEAPREISVVRAELLTDGRGHSDQTLTVRPRAELPVLTPRPVSVPGIGSRLHERSQ